MARKKSTETLDAEIAKVKADMSKLQDRYDKLAEKLKDLQEQKRRREAHRQRYPGAVHAPDQYVAAELVRAEGMGQARPDKLLLQVLRVVGIRRDHIGEDGAKHQEDNETKRDDGSLIPGKAPNHQRPLPL